MWKFHEKRLCSRSFVPRRTGTDGSHLEIATGERHGFAGNREPRPFGPIIRNTLQTQLKRLEAKGWLTREKGGPVAVYRATVAERGGRGSILAELKQRLFGGSGVSMVRCLMEDGGLTPDEVRELNQWIGSLGKGGDK